MRVAVVCPYSLSLPGGVQGQVLGLAAALRCVGHDVRVMAPCDAQPPELGIIALGNSIPTAANGSVAPIAPDPACALRTVRALRDEDFDVVHLHEPLAPGPTMISLAFAKAPCVGTFHAAGASAGYRCLAPMARLVANRLAVRCAVSEDARAMAAGALGGEYLLMPNGIDVKRFANATPHPTEGPTILFVGRHEPRKGLGVLLEAMADLPADVHLWVAGHGPQSTRLRAATSHDSRIDWLGSVNRDELAERARGADVLCAPSLYGESFGVVLLEGMAAQAVVVASDLPGYRNVAVGGEHALLVPPGDAGALAGALRKVLCEPELTRSLVAAGEARAAEFSMDRLADLYTELYACVAGN